MSEFTGFIMDIGNQMIQAYLIVYLMRGTIGRDENILRFSFIGKRWVNTVIVLQSVLFYMAVNYYPPVQRMFFGNDMVPTDSRNSIPATLLALALTFTFCSLFFRKKLKGMLYLVFLIYTFRELIRFALYTFFIRILQVPINYLMNLVEQGNSFVISNVDNLFNVTQKIWNLLYIAVFLAALYYLLRYMRKLLLFNEERQYRRTEMLFLYVPVIMGLCLCTLLRSILYSTKEREFYLVIDQYPEMHFLIPAVSILCIILIILSALILKRLILSSEKEILIETYKNRMTDMEAHIKEVERLYDGIRGMKHDMNNYVADMDALMKNAEFSQDRCSEEVKKYLDGMCETMGQLDMQCSTGNPVTDIVINRKINEAEKKNISFECNFIFPDHLGISAFDLSIVLNNSLANAMEASIADLEHSYIVVDSYIRGNMFFLEVKNNIGKLPEDYHGAYPMTTKKEDTENHGFGLKNIRNCVEKYYGKADCSIIGQEYTLSVMLQGNCEE